MLSYAMYKTLLLKTLFAAALFAPFHAAAERPSVALVLAGGGAKGYAHIPVLELIEELDIPVDMVIGTSAGAIVGGLYCAGYSPAMIKEAFFGLDWNAIFVDRPVFPYEAQLGEFGFEQNPLNLKFSRNLILNLGRGFSTGQKVYTMFKSLTAKIPSYTDFDSLPIPFRATGVELTTGRLKIFSDGDLAEAMRASMSIPAVFEPFAVEGKYYLDGGILNNLPVDEARALGCDIVIAVELKSELIQDPQAFDTSPLVAFNQTLSIFSIQKNESHYAMADVVLLPGVEDFSILDFTRAAEIYARSEQKKEAYRELLLKIRAEIYGENLPENRPERKTYSEMEDISPAGLLLAGALPFDENYIRQRFNRTLRGKSATGERLAAFIDEIYKTGRYRFVTARLDTRNETLLELRLIPMENRNNHLALGVDFQGTLSTDLSIKLKLSLNAQFRGMTGPGSVLAFGGSAPQVLSLHGLFFQPLSHNLFFRASAKAVQDQDFVTSGLVWKGQSGNSIVYAELNAGLGLKLSPAAVLFAGAAYFTGSYFEEIPDYFTFTQTDRSATRANSLVLYIGGELNTLDAPMFAHRGVLVRAGGTFLVPFETEQRVVSSLVSLDFAAAIPVSERFTLALNAFAGADLSGNLRKLPAHTILLGYNSSDRLFFPQISGRQRYGAAKTAASLTFQFEPFRKAVILGPGWFFALAGSAGSVFNDIDELEPGRLYWNATFNAGVRFTRSFGIVVRLGAGRGERENITPVLAVDFSAIRY